MNDVIHDIMVYGENGLDFSKKRGWLRLSAWRWCWDTIRTEGANRLRLVRRNLEWSVYGSLGLYSSRLTW